MSRAGAIDGFHFARAGESVFGSLTLEDCPRLVELGCRAMPDLQFSVHGMFDAQGKPALRVEAVGRVGVTCQRCLDPVEFPIDVRSELELCESEEAMASADDDVDRVLATSSMDVAALVEDEIILALPMAARHESCGRNGQTGGAERESPFAVLERLKRGG